NDLERHTLSLLQFNTGIPPAVYARYYFDLLTLGDVVALPSTGGDALRRRRRLTPRLARRLRILPPTTSVEQLGGWGGGGGGGVIFDLPLSSISLSDEDSEEWQKDKRQSGSQQRQRQCRRRRAHSASSLLSPARKYKYYKGHDHNPPLRTCGMKLSTCLDVAIDHTLVRLIPQVHALLADAKSCRNNDNPVWNVSTYDMQTWRPPGRCVAKHCGVDRIDVFTFVNRIEIVSNVIPGEFSVSSKNKPSYLANVVECPLIHPCSVTRPNPELTPTANEVREKKEIVGMDARCHRLFAGILQNGRLQCPVRQLTASGKSNAHRHHDRSQGVASGSEYEFFNYYPSGSSSSSSSTSSTSSDSSTWKSSGSSSTFSATSGCFQIPPAAVAAVTAFDPWAPCTSTGVTAGNRRRDNSSTLFLLQQDSGLY
ncbi:hypothetical protein ACTXT7_016080, partial [Hymenolepis weldensis]